MAKDDVAASLMIYDVADLTKSPNRLLAGSHRQFAHVGISTVSSQTDGGIGSLCLRRLSK